MHLYPTGELKNQTGVSLAEVIISIGILLVLFLAVFSLIQYVLNLAAENKFRMGAIMVADKKMEKIKNLPYDQIGTVAGIIHGPILDDETVAENNGIFNINTLVQYIDDPFDGTSNGNPPDLLPTDYKQVSIRARWVGRFGQKEIFVFTKIAPPGMETSVGGGVLSIIAFNAVGLPIDQADVQISNNLLNPSINFAATTDASGQLNFPGAPASIEGYEITVSKPGYSTSSTTARTVSNPNPTQPNATVLTGQKTDVSFAIDLLSNLTIKTIHQNLPTNWKVNTDLAADDQTASNLAADGAGNLYIAWQDYRSGSGSKIYWQKYNISGQAQWPAGDILISSANNQVWPDIKVSTSSSYAYISWNDNSNGNQDGYLIKRSTVDGSLQWSGPKKIDTSADSADQTNVRLALYNNGSEIITAVWQDDRNGNLDIFMQSYDDNKNKLWTDEIKVNKNTDNSGQSEPAIALDSQNNIYVAWTDERNGQPDVYAAKYDSTGQASWLNDVKINSQSGASASYAPAIALDNNDYLYVAWTDERNGNGDIYLAKYNSSGQAVWSPDNIIVSADTDYNQKFPSLAITTADNIYLNWVDERNGNQDIYAQKLDTNGNRLWTDDPKININSGSSSQNNPEIIINPFDNNAYAAWQDDRNGDFDIYASQVDLYGAITNIANVPLVVSGAKQIGNNPIIYKYLKDHSTDSQGSLTLSNIEWDSYSFSLKTGYSAYNIIMTSPEQPINLLPNASGEIILYLDNWNWAMRLDYKKNKIAGFSLIEIMVVMGIFSIFIIMSADFIIQGFRSSAFIYEQDLAVQNARKAQDIMVKEIRKANRAENGEYLLDTVLPQTFTFYSDVDSDGLTEKIRYFLDNNNLKKGLIHATGSPFGYPAVKQAGSILSKYVIVANQKSGLILS